MSEFTVSGHAYRCTNMPARTQCHVLRRMGPILDPLQTLARGGDAAEAISAFARALGTLSDEATDYIIDRCMETVQRQQGEAVWSPVKPPGVSTFMFNDIDMLAMFQIVAHVMRANYSELFRGGLSGLTGGASPSA